MKRYGRLASIVTDRLPSYRAAMKVIGNESCQETRRWFTTAAARARSGPITITNCVPSTFAGRKWTPESRAPDLLERVCSVKVLIVNEKYPPYISGGAERSVQILAEELATGRPP